MLGGPFGGTIGNQAGDGPVLPVLLAPPGVPLQRTPLTVLGVGMLDADPAGRLAPTHLTPCAPFGQRAVVQGLPRLRRRRDLIGELVGQAPVALVALGPDRGLRPDLLGDPLGADRRVPGRARHLRMMGLTGALLLAGLAALLWLGTDVTGTKECMDSAYGLGVEGRSTSMTRRAAR
jgi:hypothetical protein